MRTVPLSFLIDNMDVYRDIAAIELQYKVRALDAQIREIRRSTSLPWTLKRDTLMVYGGIKEYSIRDDHDELAYIDELNISSYEDTARLYNTSAQQFYERVNSARNLLADIWDNGIRSIGVDMQAMSLSETMLDDATSIANSVVAGDAHSLALETRKNKYGESAIIFSLNSVTSLGSITISFDSFSDSDYKNKGLFVPVYIENLVGLENAAITVGLVDAMAGDISAVQTKQFDGKPITAGWNMFFVDLGLEANYNNLDVSSITGVMISIAGHTDDNKFMIAPMYIREYKLMEYWYYSTYNVKTSASSVADKEFFIPITGFGSDVNTEDSLVGDAKWMDYVMYGAMSELAAELENDNIKKKIEERFIIAQNDFNNKFPSMTPLITTLRHRFTNDFQETYIDNE